MFAQLAGGQKFEIFPKSETEFLYPGGIEQITFVRENSGKVLKAIYRRGDLTIDAARMEDVVAARVDPASYDALVGKYAYPAGQTNTVTREGNHLFAQMSDQPKMEILPISETEFFWKDVNAQVTFVKDQRGKVTKAIHHQGGATLEAQKIE
jgi:hypothetical protein